MQSAQPAAHTGAHSLLLQPGVVTFAAEQARPQAPQLDRSLAVFTQKLEQQESPAGQVGAAARQPSTQLPDGEHILPSAQLDESRHSTQR